MNEGIYHVRFSAGAQQFGEGLAVVKGGKVNGGDPGYVYTGDIAINGGAASATLHIAQWNAAVKSVFGPMQAFDLVLTGTAGVSDFTVTGHVVGQPQRQIRIHGRFVAAAA